MALAKYFNISFTKKLRSDSSSDISAYTNGTEIENTKTTDIGVGTGDSGTLASPFLSQKGHCAENYVMLPNYGMLETSIQTEHDRVFQGKVKEKIKKKFEEINTILSKDSSSN